MENNDFLEALTMLEKEKNISREVILNAISEALMTACKQSYHHTDNILIVMDPDTCEFHVLVAKTVVSDVTDGETEISLDKAKDISSTFEVGDTVNIEVRSKEFGRIAASAAKNVMLQTIREEERNVIFDKYCAMQNQVVTGIVQRIYDKNISINLGIGEGTLSEREQIHGEILNPNDRVKVYILEVKKTKRGPKIFVSRTHPDLVRCLFEEEVSEVHEGIVEIKNIAREAGSRTKMAVYSNDEDVDPVGACVGMNGSRVNAIVSELGNEKIDIINWDENPAKLIENALSPAKVISVIADSEEKTAKVVVPDYQLSLAIGKEGQNARLAARLTGYKIDIKSETQAREAGELYDFDDEEYSEEESYDEEGYYENEDAGTTEEVDDTVDDTLTEESMEDTDTVDESEEA